MIACSGLLLLRSRTSLAPEKRVVIGLLAFGLALTLFIELFAVGGDRVNTVFKFNIQIWLLLGTAAGAAFAWIWPDREAWRTLYRRLWTGGLCLLAAMAAFYPATATGAKIRDRFPPATASVSTDTPAGCKPISGIPIPYPGQSSLAVEHQPRSLDGVDFMQWSAYCDKGWFLPLKYDYDAIRWIQDHVPGSPVIAEAQSFDLYRMSCRYAWFTGLPNVVGWDWHQRQQRAAIDTRFVTERGIETSRFYTDPGADHARAFIRKHDVRYVVVGPLEHAYYRSSGGLEKFERMTAEGLLSVAYRNPGVVIYRVVDCGSGN